MTFMSEVSIRDLRNHGGEVVDRAARGESTVIRLGEIGDPSALPIEPLITAVTLAEHSAGAVDQHQRFRTRGAPGPLQ